MKKAKPTYLALYQRGQQDICAQIHRWHDDKHLTVEYLDYFDIISFISMGAEPAFEPICVEKTHDIDLENLPVGYDDFKLHYTWLTIARDFVAEEKRGR